MKESSCWCFTELKQIATAWTHTMMTCCIISSFPNYP